MVLESQTLEFAIMHCSASPIHFWTNVRIPYRKTWGLAVQFSLIVLFYEAITSKPACGWLALLGYVINFIFTLTKELRDTGRIILAQMIPRQATPRPITEAISQAQRSTAVYSGRQKPKSGTQEEQPPHWGPFPGLYYQSHQPHSPVVKPIIMSRWQLLSRSLF